MAARTVSAKILTAKYYESRHYLELHAEGEVPWALGKPFFEPAFGLRIMTFSLRAYQIEGPSIETKKPFPSSPFTADFKYPCTLPRPGQPSGSISVETADGYKSVDIDYVEGPQTFKIQEGPGPVVLEPVYTTEYLDTINVAWLSELPGIITAKVPPTNVQTEFSAEVKSGLEVTFNPEIFRQVSSRVVNGKLEWTFFWVKGAATPKYIDVVSTEVVISGAKIIHTRVVQPYRIQYVVLENSIPPASA